MHRDTRAKINYVDVAMGMASLVGIVAVLPLLTNAVDMIETAADPLTATLAVLIPPIIIIGLIISPGVSARSG